MMAKPEKIILVGNYLPDQQQSMIRFADLVESCLKESGLAPEKLSPEPVFSKLVPKYRYSGLPKLLGYIDKFILFPRKLRTAARQAPADSLFHITDHSNAVYLSQLPTARTLVTCHDLLQIQSALRPNPRNQLSRTGAAYQTWIAKWLKRASYLACVSSKTADDIARDLPDAQAKEIRVIRQCLNTPCHPMPPQEARAALQSLLQDSAQEPFLLHVGGNQWYKNREGVIAIFARLQQHGFPARRLIMAGKPLSEKHRALIRKASLENSIANPTDVSDKELNALYAAAEALLFPSLQEGFGWPILEALQCRCPVITSNRQPMKEVSGSHAIHIDPEDTESAAQTILEEWGKRRKKWDSLEEHLELFSRQSFTRGYLSFYDAILER